MQRSTPRLAGRIGLACLLAAGVALATTSVIRGDGDNDYQQDLTGVADLIYGNAGADYIDGGAGDDWLSGNADNDQLFGGGGQDILAGGYGDDKLDGGGGADWLFGGRDNDVLDGGSGADVLYGDFGDYLLPNRAGPNVTGSFDHATGNVTVTESGKTYGGDKMIYGANGGGGADVAGNPIVDMGDDVLNGGPDDDQLHGGEGNDRFVFGANCGHDTIKDYETGEQIDVTAFAGSGITQTVENGDTVLSVNGSPIITIEGYVGAVTLLQ